MATKTFEELKQLAIQIRDEKTNKQNTATRIGTQMLEHLNKLEQDYYDKTATDKELKQRDEKLSELSSLAGVYKIFDFSSENYLANFSDIKLKAGVEYFVYAETDSKEIRLILCSKKYNYIDGNYYEDGDYPRVTFVNGKGFIKIKNDTDTDLGDWGFQSSSTAKTGTVKFTFFASMSLGQSVSAINDEITDIKGYKQVNSNVLNLNSTVNLGDLQFQITANKKYLLKVDCSNPYNVTILGNPKLNYIDGNYYEDGDYPKVNLTNGQGSIVISNSTDINLSSFGFFSTETSAMYEGNYTFTLFELGENSVSLMFLNQMINDINGDIQDINEKIDDIRGYKQVNSKIINFNSSSFQGNLQFSITANKKYLLKIDCSESNNITLFGNPSLNYIDGNYYESGNSPKVKITNGKGSIILGNDKDTSLSTWGFFSAEGVVDHEGDYKFTLFELFELGENSVSLMSLRQSIDEINIPQIAKTNGFIRIFHSMGGIGDSLSSGEIVTGSGTDDDPILYNDRYNFSWLANIARKYSADWRCFSNGGQTAQGWLGRWLSELTSEENKRSLYFIALGTNDEGLINKGQLVLGTKESNSDEASFAGYYKKIIESVHAYSPHSIIMCCTTYGKQTVLSPINNLIQEISDLYDYCYFINIAQKSTFNLGSEYVRGGHFDTLGYVKFADALEILVNDVLEENKTKLVTWGVDAPN